MHVLMIGHLTGKDYSELLEEEGKFIGKSRAEGIVGDVFLKADRTGPILILPDTTADQARERYGESSFHRPRHRNIRLHRTYRSPGRSAGHQVEPAVNTGALAIEAANLTKTYPGDVQAVKGISFDVAPGEAFGLLGTQPVGRFSALYRVTPSG